MVDREQSVIYLTMNNAEINALKSTLSNEARVLYCLVLRPNANGQTGASDTLNYKHVTTLLNATETKIELGRQINRLVKELQQAGLISVPQNVDIDKSLNGKQVLLPLVLLKDDKYQQLHQTRMPISLNWVPDESLFTELAQLVGLIDKDFSDEEAGEFTAYWLGRPESLFSPFQWTQKFVSHLKQRRLAKHTRPVKKIGSQLTTAKSGIEADENARKLVEKYSTKQ